MPDPAQHTAKTTLLQAREMRGWSREQAAEMLTTTSMSLYRWESGRALPSPYFRQKLADLYGQSLAALGLLPGQEDEAKLVATTLLLPAFGQELTDLIGREELFAILKHHLCALPPVARVALTGLPGVGKTTLALALAHDSEIQATFADGILWAGLGHTPILVEVFQRWGRWLRISSGEMTSFTSLSAWAEALRNAIGQRRLLIILDDVWRSTDAIHCQIGGPHCSYLLTTRFPDLVIQLGRTAVFPIPELSEAEGVNVLRQFVPRVIENEAEEALHLVRKVGSLPLALTLMGRYLQHHAYSEQPRRIKTAISSLHQSVVRMSLTQPQSPLETHPSLSWETPLSLQASIGMSVTALPLASQAMLITFGIFPPKPSTFSEEVALEVSAGEPAALDALIDAGLVESVGEDRFHMHQTIVDYAHLHVVPPEAEQRFIGWAMKRIATQHQDETTFEPDLHLFLAALRLAHDRQEGEIFIQGSTMLSSYLLSQGDYATVEHLLGQAQSLASIQADPSYMIDILHLLSIVSERRGDYDQEETFLQQGLALARQHGDTARLARFLMTYGMLFSYRGDNAQAQREMEEALVLARQGESVDLLIRILSNLASLDADQGQLEQAECHNQEALAFAQAAGLSWLQCSVLIGLSQVALRRSNYAMAQGFIQQAIALARTFHYPELVCNALTNLGVFSLDQGQFTQAEEAFEESLAWAKELGHRGFVCRALINLSEVRLRQERLSDAEQILVLAQDLVYQLNHQHYRCHCLRLLGEMHLKQGHLEQAEQTIQKGIALARDSGYQWVLCAMVTISGDIALAHQQSLEAQTRYDEALQMAQEMKCGELEAAIWYGLARVAALWGEKDQALKNGQKSLHLFVTHGLFQAASVQHWMAHLPQEVYVESSYKGQQEVV